MVLPARSSLTQYGDAAAAPVVLVLVPLLVVRRWNARPLLYEISMNACAEPASSVSRIMTPAFTQALVFWTAATRATIDPSPDKPRYANWSASAVPHTSAPPPVTSKTPLARL